jgi:hypothetical protein
MYSAWALPPHLLEDCRRKEGGLELLGIHKGERLLLWLLYISSPAMHKP